MWSVETIWFISNSMEEFLSIKAAVLPAHWRPPKGANRSAPHVLPCALNFGSHFLPQPSDAVKFFSLVQLQKESMTHRTGYVRSPAVRGRHVEDEDSVTGVHQVTPCLDLLSAPHSRSNGYNQAILKLC